MTASLEEILSANQKLHVQVQELTRENKLMREALTRLTGHNGDIFNIAREALSALEKVKK
jgi:hypothetical protein